MVLPSKIPKFAIQPDNSRHNEVVSSIKVERVWNILECSEFLIPTRNGRKQELTQNTVSG